MGKVLYEPRPVYQLKNDPLHPAGSKEGGSNCAATVGAILLDRMTKGAHRTTGAAVREATRVHGPLRPDQVDAALNRVWHVDVITALFTEADLWEGLLEGRGFSAVMLYAPVADAGRAFSGQETGFRGLHQEFYQRMNADRDAVLVMDPLADRRRPSIPLAPIWYPKALVLRSLRGARDDGRVWGSFTNTGWIDLPDGVTFRYHGLALYRHAWRAMRATNLRSSPTIPKRHPTENIVRAVPKGFIFRNAQTTNGGTEVDGSRRWYGDATGRIWVPAARMRRA